MKVLWIVATILCLVPSQLHAKRRNAEAFAGIKKESTAASDAQTAINDPSTPPQKKPELQTERAGHLDNIDHIADQNKDDDQVQATATQAFLDNGENKRALPHADQYVALARDSGNPDLYNKAEQLRANVYFSMKNYPAAARDAADILKRSPSDEEARKILAFSRNRGDASGMSNGNPTPEAPPPDSNPSSPATNEPIRKNMTQILNKAQQDEQMKEAAGFTKAAANASGLGDHGEAKKQLDLALGKAPGNAQLLNMRAKEELELKDNAAALKDAQAASASDPKFADAQRTQALAMAASGASREEFERTLKAAYAVDPNLQPSYDETMTKFLAQSDSGTGQGNPMASEGPHRLGFDKQRALNELFSFIPESDRVFVIPVGMLAMVGLIIVISTLLKHKD